MAVPQIVSSHILQTATDGGVAYRPERHSGINHHGYSPAVDFSLSNGRFETETGGILLNPPGVCYAHSCHFCGRWRLRKDLFDQPQKLAGRWLACAPELRLILLGVDLPPFSQKTENDPT